MNNLNPIKTHFTQFTIDLIHKETSEPTSIQQFVENEPEYDLAFCSGMKILETNHSKLIIDPKIFLSTLDQINKSSISHLQLKNDEKPSLNHFPINKDITSDEVGIREIIKKIWLEQSHYALIARSDNISYAYHLTHEYFALQKGENQSHQILYKNNSINREETLTLISTKILELYRRGLCIKMKQNRLVMVIHIEASEREKLALSIISDYFKQMNQAQSDLEQKHAIIHVIKNLSHLHLYNDGNARSLYILANLLLLQNGMRMFYPQNMCVFEGCSIDHLVDEISEGQERFKLMFGSKEELIEGLNAYESAVTKLKSFILPDNMRQALDKRNFNFLLRLTAALPRHLPELKFLLENKQILNIDIKAKGKTSGSALDIACKYGNHEAIVLLNSHGLSN